MSAVQREKKWFVPQFPTYKHADITFFVLDSFHFCASAVRCIPALENLRKFPLSMWKKAWGLLSSYLRIALLHFGKIVISPCSCSTKRRTPYLERSAGPVLPPNSGQAVAERNAAEQNAAERDAAERNAAKPPERKTV